MTTKLIKLLSHPILILAENPRLFLVDHDVQNHLVGVGHAL